MINYVWSLWIYDRAGRRPELWSLFNTEIRAYEALNLTGKTGFVAKLPVGK